MSYTKLESWSTTVVLDTCWCGIWFGMPENLHRLFREEGQTVYCPLGHSVVVQKTETQRLREKQKQLEAQLVSAQDQHKATQRSLRATKGSLTRTKNRIKAGVCPFCNRHFDNVKRHMTSKHPEEKA